MLGETSQTLHKIGVYNTREVIHMKDVNTLLDSVVQHMTGNFTVSESRRHGIEQCDSQILCMAMNLMFFPLVFGSNWN